MTAKKTRIQQLKKEAIQLKETIQNQRIAIKRHERKIKVIELQRFIFAEELACDADNIRLAFNQELAWQELSNNANHQLDVLNRLTSWIRSKVDAKNAVFMDKHMDNNYVAFYYKQKIKRSG